MADKIPRPFGGRGLSVSKDKELWLAPDGTTVEAHTDAAGMHALGCERICKQPPHRLYSWIAGDGTLCVACCECGKPLKGAL